MKRIVLLAVLSLSLFSMSCGGGASTCAEANDVIADECKDDKDVTTGTEAIKVCNDSPIKEEQIECANAGDCDEIKACVLKAALGALSS